MDLTDLIDIDWIALILRWLHLVAASAAIGGTLFMRLALVPSMSVLEEGARKSLRGELRRRWAKVVMAAILFLLVSGFINFYFNLQMFKLTTIGKAPAFYQAVFGIKFMCALVVFFISSVLVGRGQATEKLRENAKFWLNLNLVLLLTIVALSNILRSTHAVPKDYKPPTEKPPVAQHFDDIAHHG